MSRGLRCGTADSQRPRNRLPAAVPSSNVVHALKCARMHLRARPARTFASTHDDAEQPRRTDEQDGERAYTGSELWDIGGEHGQGFMKFSKQRESLRLDVDDLNEQLEIKGRLRLRHSMKPDEQHGMIFCWEGVTVDTRRLKEEAWARVASMHGFELPRYQRPQMYLVSPERAVLDVLHWTADVQLARNIAYDVALEFNRSLSSLARPCPGLVEWLRALHACSVPCAIIANIDRASLRANLQRMAVLKYFRAFVTPEGGMETRSQQLLSAAIELGRPPNKCVAFVSDERGVTAAHNASVKAVAVTTMHPGYKLRNADVTCASLDELRVYNIRRLFSNAGSEFMDLRQLQAPGKHAPSMKRVNLGTLW